MKTKKQGVVVNKLSKVMQERNMSKNKLSVLTGLSFTGVQRYYNSSIKRVDLDVLAKICSALNCKVEDILEYKE